MNQRMRQYAVSLAAIGLLAGATTTSTHASSVSGEAFGVFVNAAGVRVGPTPHVVLPPDGGMVSDRLLGIAVPNAAASSTLEVVTTGSIGPHSASAQSSATVEVLHVLNDLVKATAVVAVSSSTADGSTATSSSEGSTILGLSINGSELGDVTPPPNTQIAIPFGTVTLNEQIRSGDGVHTSALTVNMIHVVLTDSLTGTITADIVVSSAHSDVNFVPAPKAGNAFMTGGGKLGTGRDIATFGLNAGERGGVLHGHLQYTDHGRNLNVHSTMISSFTPPPTPAGNTCVSFSGPARVNNVDGYNFTVNSACDNGEPGVGLDSLDISVTGPGGFSYGRSGKLTGGNLQLHPE